MSIRVVHFTQSLGGVEVVIKNIVSNIDDNLFESIIIAPKFIDVKSKSGKQIKVFIRNISRDVNPVLDFIYFIKIGFLIYQIKPKLVHCHSSKAGFIGRIACKILKTPSVFTPHGFSFLAPLSKKTQTIFLRLEQFASFFTTNFLPISESELILGVEKAGINIQKCFLWKNCVSQVTFDNLPQLDTNEYVKPYICTIGRPSYQKNLEIIVEAISLLKQKGILIRCYFLGVGLYSPDKNKIQELIITKGVQDLCILKEWIDHSAALQVLSNSDFFVLSSRYEGLPLSVIEAMALGKAVIATDVFGTRDIVVHNKTGKLYEKGNSTSLAANIQLLIENKQLCLQMGNEGKQEYLRAYNTKDRISVLENYFQDIVGKTFLTKANDKKRIRILHVSQSLGGVLNSIKNIVANLDTTCFESILLAPKVFCIVSNVNNKVYIQSKRLIATRSINPFIDILTFIQICYFIIYFKVDIVHCHSSKVGILGRFAARILGKKSIFSPRGFSFLSTRHVILKKLYLIFEKTGAYFTDYLLACSLSEKELALKAVGIKESKIVVWENCFKKELFDNLFANEMIISKPYICFVGRPSYQKNIRMLIDALTFLKKTRNPIQCHIVGLGNYAPERKKILKLITQNNLQNIIHLHGWLEHKDTLRIISNSTLLVLTSRYEGLPLSIIEAMALEKATVATNVYGTCDIIVDQKTGILVDLDDYKAMAQTIKRLVEDDILRKKLEDNAREEYVKKYDTNNKIGEIEKIYKKIYEEV